MYRTDTAFLWAWRIMLVLIITIGLFAYGRMEDRVFHLEDQVRSCTPSQEMP